LGDRSVPVACLGVLLPGRPQTAAQALLGQALFSARAVELALALRYERSANLQVAAGLAHEVRNPLTAVKGFLELTLAHRSEVPEYAGVALKELDRAISLLEDYSLLSRAPRIQPTQPVSISGLVSEAALVARGLVAAGPQVIIDHTDSEPGLETLADPPRLKQVLLNLCRNAVEAMPEGGVLTLKAAREAGEVVIEITDTGVGIPASEVSQIFEPFYTTKATGTGLGLSVCRRIVEAHGGRITLDSRPGRGTTFRVHLPLFLKLVEGRPLGR
jgi:signal transduction histidine kinase